MTNVSRLASIESIARPTNRTELLAAAAEEFRILLDAVETVPAEHRESPGACDDWSVKDLLAHLDAWHELFLTWEADGASGMKPAIPAPGYRWSDAPALNQVIYDEHAVRLSRPFPRPGCARWVTR